MKENVNKLVLFFFVNLSEFININIGIFRKIFEKPIIYGNLFIVNLKIFLEKKRAVFTLKNFI